MPKVAARTARFNLLKKKKTDKVGFLLLVFRLGDKRLNYSLGHYIHSSTSIKDWDAKRQRLKTIGKDLQKIERCKEINNQLFEIKNYVEKYYLQNPEITREALRLELDYYTGKEDRPTKEGKRIPTFFEAIDELIVVKDNMKTTTGTRFKIVKKHLKAFQRSKKIKLTYDSFDWKMKNDLQNWLYKKDYATNYASKLFGHIKQILRETSRLGYHNNKIYLEKGYSLEKKRTNHRTVFSFSELNVLKRTDLSAHPRLERVRDLFIVGCYTGLRFSDWHKVKKQNIIQQGDAQLLSIVTQKTVTDVYIPCLPELIEVLEKYDYELPTISGQKFNEYIKEVVQMALPDSHVKITEYRAGVSDTKVVPKHEVTTSHCARRSFATNFFELGIPAAILIQITGHSTEKQFFEYVDADKKKLAAKFAEMVAASRNSTPLKVVR